MKNLLIKILLAVCIPASLLATGPRIKGTIFAPNHNEIVAVEAPPHVSNQQPNGGMLFEIISVALKTQNESATLSTYPSEKMVKYYLTQENALGMIGKDQKISAVEKKNFVLLPIALIRDGSNAKESTGMIVFNLKNPDAKTVSAQVRSGMSVILKNGQYQSIIEKYESKPAAAEHVANFKKLWTKEVSDK